MGALNACLEAPMLKHLFYLPGYLVRFGWNVMFTLGALKNMGDAQRALASNTTFGLAFNSLLGWIAVVALVFVALSPKHPHSEAQATDRPQVSAMVNTPTPSLDKPVESTANQPEPSKPLVAVEMLGATPDAVPVIAPETRTEPASTNAPLPMGDASPGPTSEPEKAESASRP
jgi:hypothetical protein